jgi:hypothetical protein
LCLVLLVNTYCIDHTDYHHQKSLDGYERKTPRPTNAMGGQFGSPLHDHTYLMLTESLNGLFATVEC